MNRATLQQLAQDRLLDAQALLAAGRWAAAYYLAGYAVECALKACVLRHIDATGAIYTDGKYLRALAECRTHDFEVLIKLADLTQALGQARGVNTDLDLYWTEAGRWNESSRYTGRTEADARNLIAAILHDPDGVLRWLQQHW